ncbi:hypothetical protein MHU86_12555 [Fragilaria crotonensis]|nr:hypothetical protein MHU86_12555 [Fragilaria crotonensis]
MVSMPITIQNSKFVRHSAVCIINRFSIGLFLVKMDNEMQMVNMAITIQNLKFVRHSVDCILNRFSIGLFLVKIDNEMQRWSTWQSRFKT